jgi:hypothetical protein
MAEGMAQFFGANKPLWRRKENKTAMLLAEKTRPMRVLYLNVN